MKSKYKISTITQKFNHQQKQYIDTHLKSTIDPRIKINDFLNKRREYVYGDFITTLIHNNYTKSDRKYEEQSGNGLNYVSLNKLQANDEYSCEDNDDEMNKNPKYSRRKEKILSSKDAFSQNGIWAIKNKWKNNILRRNNYGNYGKIIKGNTKQKHDSLMSQIDQIIDQNKKTFIPIGDLSIPKKQNTVYHIDEKDNGDSMKRRRLVISTNAVRKIPQNIHLMDIDRRYLKQKRTLTEPTKEKRYIFRDKKGEKSYRLKMISSLSPEERFTNSLIETPCPWEVTIEF